MRAFTMWQGLYLASIYLSICSLTIVTITALRLAMNDPEQDQGPEHWALELRQQQQPDCGPQAGGAFCDEQLCCSEDGFCGIGPYYCASPSCQFRYSTACDANQSPSGSNTTDIPRPKFGQIAYGVEIQHCTQPGMVALTFDGGPTTWTETLLKHLYEKDAKATFFVTGNSNGRGMINSDATPFPDIIKRMHDWGHQIGSRGWSGEDWARLSDDEINKEIVFNEMALAEILGFIPTYFRPPEDGCYKECMNSLERLGYHVIGWELDTEDLEANATLSQNTFADTISSHDATTKGWLVLGHDDNELTADAMITHWVDKAIELGYKVTTLGECLGDKKHNWYRDAKTGDRWMSEEEIEEAETSSKDDEATAVVSTVFETPTVLVVEEGGDEPLTHTSSQPDSDDGNDEMASTTSPTSSAEENSSDSKTSHSVEMSMIYGFFMVFVVLISAGWAGI